MTKWQHYVMQSILQLQQACQMIVYMNVGHVYITLHSRTFASLSLFISISCSTRQYVRVRLGLARCFASRSKCWRRTRDPWCQIYHKYNDSYYWKSIHMWLFVHNQGSLWSEQIYNWSITRYSHNDTTTLFFSNKNGQNFVKNSYTKDSTIQNDMLRDLFLMFQNPTV